MTETRKEFEISKKLAIAKLAAEALPIVKELSDDPDLGLAIQDRLDHIERGELWITPAMLKYSPMIMRLEQIRTQMENVKATMWAGA